MKTHCFVIGAAAALCLAAFETRAAEVASKGERSPLSTFFVAPTWVLWQNLFFGEVAQAVP